jgi:hypothetical protein
MRKRVPVFGGNRDPDVDDGGEARQNAIPSARCGRQPFTFEGVERLYAQELERRSNHDSIDRHGSARRSGSASAPGTRWSTADPAALHPPRVELRLRRTGQGAYRVPAPAFRTSNRHVRPARFRNSRDVLRARNSQRSDPVPVICRERAQQVANGTGIRHAFRLAIGSRCCRFGHPYSTAHEPYLHPAD